MERLLLHKKNREMYRLALLAPRIMLASRPTPRPRARLSLTCRAGFVHAGRAGKGKRAWEEGPPPSTTSAEEAAARVTAVERELQEEEVRAPAHLVA